VDPVQFRIAVMNLVRNALRHARQGSITVRVLREDDDSVVTVADEGRGVPEAVRDRIFEPFVTGHAETAEPRGGSGLGLFICKRIVERHDGTVTMEDRGGGSIFVVRLPWDDGRGDQRSAS
jgi:signal transduction histidine kinase